MSARAAVGSTVAESGQRRIVMIFPWLVMGGADKFNLNLVANLKARGWQVTIVTTLAAKDVWADEFFRHTDDIVALHRLGPVGEHPALLREVIETRHPDVVLVSHSELAYLLLPYLRFYCPRPVYLDYCHIEEMEWLEGGFPSLSVRYRASIDCSLVASEYLKRWMVSRGGDPERIRVCRINVDSERWRPVPELRRRVREELRLEGTVPVVLFAARLCRQKRPLLFARTLAALASEKLDFVALVAGDGEDRAALERYVEKHRLRDRVMLLGSLPIKRMREILLASDILFLPSQNEGISLTIYEAMACEVAVVAADVGGQRELVVDGTGVLVAPGADRQACTRYAAALRPLLADARQREQLGRAARDRVLKGFTLPQMVDAFEEICCRATDNRREEVPLANAAAAEGLAEQVLDYLRAFGRNSEPIACSPLSRRAKLYAWIARLLGPLYFWCLDRELRWVIAVKDQLRKRTGLDG